MNSLGQTLAVIGFAPLMGWRLRVNSGCPIRIKTVLLRSAAAVLALSVSAQAADRHGWYFGLEGGIVKVVDNNGAFGNPVEYENGWAGLAEVGYAFNGHWRV